MVYNPPLCSNYSHLKLDEIDKAHIDMIMGNKGQWFKVFTTISNLKYVWYDKKNNWIELWGRHDAIEYGMPILKSRIDMIVSNITCS